MSALREKDPDVALAIENESERQRRNIVLIASENYASKAVLEAQGSVLTNKYAEGYPGRRYYGGCEYVDIAEQLAIDRAGALFGAEYVNVQPHSGAQANMAAYFAVLEPGDTVLGMRLDQGGHLTHGSPVNFSGKLYNFAAYGVDKETERVGLRRGGAAGLGAQAQGHCGRVHGLSQDNRLSQVQGDRRQGGRAADGGHGAHRRTHSCGRSPFAAAPRRRCHVHHPQDNERAKGRIHPVHP